MGPKSIREVSGSRAQVQCSSHGCGAMAQGAIDHQEYFLLVIKKMENNYLKKKSSVILKIKENQIYHIGISRENEYGLWKEDTQN